MALGINFLVGRVLRGEKENKFNIAPGTSADSNILKIYGMLDRTNGDKHYYQVSHAELSVNVI